MSFLFCQSKRNKCNNVVKLNSRRTEYSRTKRKRPPIMPMDFSILFSVRCAVYFHEDGRQCREVPRLSVMTTVFMATKSLVSATKTVFMAANRQINKKSRFSPSKKKLLNLTTGRLSNCEIIFYLQ